jgi:predicted amidohydrolase
MERLAKRQAPQLLHILWAFRERQEPLLHHPGVRKGLVFYPNNRSNLPAFEVFGHRARTIRAPMLVTNRVGESWVHATKGGCVAYSAQGEVLAKANREGKEEILHVALEV